MKHLSILSILAAAAFASPVLAQSTPRAPASPARDAAPETRAQVEAQIRTRLGAMDANKDGTVSADEFRAYGQSRAKADADEEFVAMDADRSGQVSRAEFDAYHAAQPARRGYGGMGSMGGMGSREMMTGMRDGMRAGGGLVIADTVFDALQRFDATDANKDGRVTPEERRAMRDRLDAARASRQQSQQDQ